MARQPSAIIFRNKLYRSVKEAALLTFYSESAIRKAISKHKRKRGSNEKENKT